jgi:hypothetical protein
MYKDKSSSVATHRSGTHGKTPNNTDPGSPDFYSQPIANRWKSQTQQTDSDQRDYMQVKHTSRELGEFIENLDGNPTESTKAGKSAPLPRVTK